MSRVVQNCTLCARRLRLQTTQVQSLSFSANTRSFSTHLAFNQTSALPLNTSLDRSDSRQTVRSSTILSKMSGATAVYSTASLAESRATMYKSMAGKVQQPLLDALQQRGYEYMTPVQEKVLTELPSFSSDCLVQAKTGTGKTVAFLLPTLNRILQARNQRKGDVSVLIISPTRELAMQIKAECDMLTARVRPALECHTAFGGTKKEKHLADFLSGNPTVLVATPGRLNDYLSDEHVASKFSNLQALILDEADTMLEAGFLPAITEVLRRIPPKSAGWQGMCFSATVPEKIKPVLGKVLKPGYTSLSTVDPNEVPTIEAVDQYSVIAPTISDVLPTLAALIEQERAQTPNLKAIVFGATANGVGLLYDLFVPLVGSSIKVHELHSRLSQSTRSTAEQLPSPNPPRSRTLTIFLQTTAQCHPTVLA